MNTSNLRRAVAFAPPFLLLFAFFSLAVAEEAPAPAAAPAPASAAAAAPAPASASAAAPADPSAPSLGEWSPPETASEKPTAEEWEKATPLELLRPHEFCTASAVREWLRVSCRDPRDEFKGLRVVGGSEQDVSITDFKVKGKSKDFEGKEIDKTFDGLHVVFPVRKGDRRVMSLVSWASCGWKCWYMREDTFVTISELWLPGEERPTIVLH
ncbi:hypothetical protein [Polyangium jinanense]|uniref:Lipoprotein n=1 Tax=Polyangium jinanense TaxID=2829994 RepID=A0A9X3XDX7_9BACT|nr:hypothetical protein [Polyangium jinanense]MDC3961202.1 hypothetical protein [Polyangium jinanense]MDC3988604.1 hypothetical protein [Polyangium jinanense]